MRHILLASLPILLITLYTAACGSDKTSASGAGNANKAACVPITDADLPPALNANDCSTKMLAAYPGNAFSTVNSAIIAKALDPANAAIVGSSFQDKLVNATPERRKQFSDHLLAFLKAVYSGNMSLYPSDAPSMVDSHMDLDITLDQYKAFINEIVVKSLLESGVSLSDVQNCFAPPVMNHDFIKSVVKCK